VLGGCIALLENTLSTPWELDTLSSILMLGTAPSASTSLTACRPSRAGAGKSRGVVGSSSAISRSAIPQRKPYDVRDRCAASFIPLSIPLPALLSTRRRC
jgi:hypothetical protein